LSALEKEDSSCRENDGSSLLLDWSEEEELFESSGDVRVSTRFISLPKS